MKFYLDEDISPKIADLLRQRNIDCTSAHEVGMLQTSDLEQLRLAGHKNRCLVTRNRDDFIQLTVRFFNDHLPHGGVLIIPHTIAGDQFSVIADALEEYAREHPDGPPPYTIDFLALKNRP